MSKHTHTPWRIKHQYNITDDNNRSVSTCGGFSDMTEESHNENLANAAYIVHCVNNHEALVEFLYNLAAACSQLVEFGEFSEDGPMAEMVNNALELCNSQKEQDA